MQKRVFWWVLAGCGMLPLFAGAQFTSRLGRFQVDQRKGCAPFQITVTAAMCTGVNDCLMNFTGAAWLQNQFTFTYTTPGTYTLTVLHQNIGADDIQITVDQNIQPNFEMYACANRGVQVRVFDNNYDQYLIDFQNDGVPESIQPFSNNITAQFTYPTTAPATIAVRGRDLASADNCAARTQVFTPLVTLPPPSITALTALDPTSLRLDFAGQPNIQYRLEIATNNNANFQLVQTFANVSTATIPNLRLDDNFHCFRLSAFSPCTNTNAFSNTVCSQNVDLILESGLNRLTIATAAAGITQTQIARTPSPSDVLPGARLVYEDPDVTCNVEYCYQVTMIYAGGARSTSLQKCGVAFFRESPAAVNNVTSVVNGGVTLSYQVGATNNPPKEFSIFRGVRQRGLSFLAKTTNANLFSDNTYTTEENLCYRINYEDICGNISQEGALVCPVRLLAVRDARNVVTLNWSQYSGWRQGVRGYTLEKFNSQGGLIQAIDMGTDTTYIDNVPDFNNQVVVYRVRATAVQNGLAPSISNSVRIVKEITVSFPTAFSPDGEGPTENETFRLTTQFVHRMSLNIFDRWGVLLYSTDRNEPWNGRSNGREMPSGTYVWQAEITDQAGQTTSRTGTLVLLRKR
jgi:gliding motility-associated-like protein